MGSVKRRPWFRILRDLMAVGISMGKIAKACQVSCTRVVQHWAEDGEPKDTHARIILALYRKHCPEKYEAHMREFDPATLELEHRVWVKPDRAIRGRPRPEMVGVQPAGQFDFFAGEAS